MVERDGKKKKTDNKTPVGWSLAAGQVLGASDPSMLNSKWDIDIGPSEAQGTLTKKEAEGIERAGGSWGNGQQCCLLSMEWLFDS